MNDFGLQLIVCGMRVQFATRPAIRESYPQIFYSTCLNFFCQIPDFFLPVRLLNFAFSKKRSSFGRMRKSNDTLFRIHSVNYRVSFFRSKFVDNELLSDFLLKVIRSFDACFLFLLRRSIYRVVRLSRIFLE